MSKVLTFGQMTKPKVIVVVFHALCDYAEANLRESEQCTRGVDGAMVVIPQSPGKCSWTWRTKGRPIFDWLIQKGTQDTTDHVANKREVQRVVRARLRQVNSWLDLLLKRQRLSNSQLILVGFSQGAILASLLGARRRVLGVALCGGVPNQGVWSARSGNFIGGWRGWWMGFEEFIPKSCKSGRLPQFCIVNGTEDTCVLPRKNKAMFAQFPVSWHWDEGAGHDFPSRWMTVVRNWMVSVVEGKHSTT